MRQVQSIILCEGYHDRAFWSGMLTHRSLGLEDIREKAWGDLDPGRDPWNVKVRGEGHYGYTGPTGRFVRVVPRRDEQRLFDVAKTYIESRAAKPVDQLVYCRDWDAAADETEAKAPDAESYLAAFQRLAPGATRQVASTILLDDGCQIHIVLWRTDDSPAPGIPQKQTLERIVCAALAAAYRDRATAVEQWLTDQRVNGKDSHKAHAMSYMAGWAAGHGSEDFYRAVWDDPEVAGELETRLRNSGAWQAVEALVDPAT